MVVAFSTRNEKSQTPARMACVKRSWREVSQYLGLQKLLTWAIVAGGSLATSLAMAFFSSLATSPFSSLATSLANKPQLPQVAEIYELRGNTSFEA